MGDPCKWFVEWRGGPSGAASSAASILTLALAATSTWADVRLPAFVGDNMVLQRDQDLRITGTATPGESVRVTFRGETAVAVAAAKGCWSVRLRRQAAGGPYEMVVSGRNTLKLTNILVGDVWIASGQSNMEFSLSDSAQGAAAVAAARDPGIRLFRVPHDVSSLAQHDVLPAAWQESSPSAAADFSAVAFLFARELRALHHVPIGVIESAWSGSSIESWMSAQSLRQFPEYAHRLRALETITPQNESTYRTYANVKARWNAAHRAEDRGMVEGRALWADPAFDATPWPLIDVPRPDSAWGVDFDGFDGTVWLRRDVEIPRAFSGLDLELHLGAPFRNAEVFYDGKPIEAVAPDAGTYRVIGERVHSGRTVLAQRLTGSNGYLMLSGKPQDVYARAREARLPLAGLWSYHTGADLTDLPKLVLLGTQDGFPGVAVLSNAMIEPFAATSIKGVIWYQGESNVGAPDLYRRLFPALIQDWRRRWHAEIPFLFVQLAGYGSDPHEPGDSSWAELREAQQGALLLPRTGMASAVDLGDSVNVHPKNKLDVARRLARAARRVAYGENTVASGPEFRSMRLEADRLRVRFAQTAHGLVVHDRYGYPRGFAIAAKEGPFMWAHATIDGNDVLIWNDAVRRPSRVRYGWANTPDGDLYNSEGLPAVPFRSDRPADYNREN